MNTCRDVGGFEALRIGTGKLVGFCRLLTLIKDGRSGEAYGCYGANGLLDFDLLFFLYTLLRIDLQ